MKRLLPYLLLATLGLLLYYIFDPVRFSLFPPCPLFRLTGLLCPLCGTQRALHALLHGDLVVAYHFNPFLFWSLPLLLTLLLERCLMSDTPLRATLRHYLEHRYTLYIYLSLLFAWFIVRNLNY